MISFKEVQESSRKKICYCKEVTKLDLLDFIKFNPNATEDEIVRGIKFATSCRQCLKPKKEGVKYDIYYKDVIK